MRKLPSRAMQRRNMPEALNAIHWVAGSIIPLLPALVPPALADGDSGAEVVDTPYEAQKVLFEFYFNDPDQTAPALYWIRAVMNPLTAAPYEYAPDDLSLKVVIHGTEIVTLVKHNYEKYRDVVERMRYYSELGVEFKVCALAAHDFGYRAEDFQDFVQVVPSAMTEMAHWQMKGYALIQPRVLEKRFSTEEIR